MCRMIGLTLLIFNLFLLGACTTKKDSFLAGSLGLGEDRIYVSGTYSALSSFAVTVYDTDGNLLHILKDYGVTGEFPRGIAAVDPFHLVFSIDGTDRLDIAGIFGEVSTFASNANLTGNLYDVEGDSAGNFYVAETSTIERFSADGARYPVTGNPYINTTTGSCVLNTIHGLALTSLGYIATVSSAGTDNLSIYNVSTGTATCVANVAFGNDPWDLVSHPNGLLYVVTQLNDRIYTVNEDGTGSTSIYTYPINTANPSAIAVLPNGNLLVAQTGTDAIDLFASDGSLIQADFIRNSFTADVSDILVVEGQ
jgi:hypothetical protein